MTKIIINGRKARRSKIAYRIAGGVLALALLVLVLHPLISTALDRELHVDVPNPFPLETAHADSTMDAKVEALKDEIVNDLARKCETKEVAEPDAAMILDTNNEMSIGAWMFQVKTVQHDVQHFEGREITRLEAVRIAIDHEQARALAKRIIFDEQGGIYNWANCAQELELVPEIAVIKKLEQ